MCLCSIVPGLWWGPAEAPCPPAPAERAACRRGWGVWRACWGGGAGPAPASLCSETSKCERESEKTAKTPSERGRWSLSETPNLQKTLRDDGSARPGGNQQNRAVWMTVKMFLYLLLWETHLHQSADPECTTWHSQSKEGPSTSASCRGRRSKNKPWGQQNTLWQRHWRKMSSRSTNNADAGYSLSVRGYFTHMCSKAEAITHNAITLVCVCVCDLIQHCCQYYLHGQALVFCKPLETILLVTVPI